MSPARRVVAERPAFDRDALTWLHYALLAFYAYVQAALGPAMPFLRDDLRLSYTVGGLHPSAFALGMIAVGLLGDRVLRAAGRKRALWGGAVGMAAGTLLFLGGRVAPLTLAGTLAMGLMGSLLLVTIQAVLTDHHGAQRATALTEANVAASAGASLAPLAVGGLAGLAVGWRAGLLLPLLFLAILALAFRGVALPIAPAGAEASEGGPRLPRRFWLFWSVLVLSVAVEWCLVLWSADFLATVGGFSTPAAATLVSAFLGAAIVGRIAGSRLTLVAPSETLLVGAMLVSSVGFALFWLLPLPPLRVTGLVLCGLGVANLFPLTLAVAVGLAPTQSDAASARVALGAGIAILLAPLTLGGVADAWGLQRAFALVAVLLGAALALVIVARATVVRAD